MRSITSPASTIGGKSLDEDFDDDDDDDSATLSIAVALPMVTASIVFEKKAWCCSSFWSNARSAAESLCAE